MSCRLQGMRETYLNIGSSMLLGTASPFFSRSPGSRASLRDAPGWPSLSLFSRKSSAEELLFLSLCCTCLPLHFPPAGTVQTERSRVVMLHALQARHCFDVKELPRHLGECRVFFGVCRDSPQWESLDRFRGETLELS